MDELLKTIVYQFPVAGLVLVVVWFGYRGLQDELIYLRTKLDRLIEILAEQDDNPL